MIGNACTQLFARNINRLGYIGRAKPMHIGILVIVAGVLRNGKATLKKPGSNADNSGNQLSPICDIKGLGGKGGSASNLGNA
jgi:hypothetical protein